MLEKHRTIRGTHRAGQTPVNPTASRISVPAPAPVTPATGIVLPKLAPSIPKEVSLLTDVAKPFRHLLTFIDAGLVAESDIPEGSPEAATLIGNALESWAKPYANTLTLHDLSLDYYEDIEQAASSYHDNMNEYLSVCGIKPGQEYIGFAISAANGCDEVFIGKKVEEIEAQRPGLGKSIVALLNRATCRIGVFNVTPAYALEVCSYIKWRGDEDESELLAELEDEGISAEDADVFTKAEFYTNLPEWATSMSIPWTIDQVREACAELGDISTVAKAMLPLMEKLDDEGRYAHSVHGGFDNVDPTLMIRWGEDDNIYRLYDDAYQYFCEAENTMVHRYFISPADPESLKRTMDSVTKFIEDVAELEALLRTVIGG